MHRSIILLFVFALPCSPTLAIEFDAPPDAPIESDDATPDVFGDDFVPGLVCDICRDPYENPMDFVGVAYNAFFGDGAWLLGSDVSWPFRIYNLNGDWVVVWFENVMFDTPSLLPNLMNVVVRFENGLVVPYTVLQDGPILQIGPETEPEPEPESGSADCSCGDGGEDDGDYTDPEEEWEYEEPEYEGVVEIVDPDEDGEYPDFYEEL